MSTGTGEGFPDKQMLRPRTPRAPWCTPGRKLPNAVFLPLDAASNCVTEKPPTTQPSLTFTLPAAGTPAGTTAAPAAATAPAPAPSPNPLLESLKKLQSSASLPPSPGEWASPLCRTGHGSVSLEAEVARPPAPETWGSLSPCGSPVPSWCAPKSF